MDDWTTADLCDANTPSSNDGVLLKFKELQVLQPCVLKDYGGLCSFKGPAATLRVLNDNSLVRKALESPGDGKVLVVDGKGSLQCALLGDNLAALAIKNGWNGIIINGCIRDSKLIKTMDIGVKAIGTHPKKSVKRNSGKVDVDVAVAGVTIKPNDYIYADEDGVLVAEGPLREVD